MSLRETIETLLNEAGNTVQQDFFCENPDPRWCEDETKQFLTKLDSEGITFELTDSYGGEDMGRDYWSVYTFSKGDEEVHVKFDGWYESYNGSEFEEWFFVTPQPVQKIEFVRV